MASIGNHGLLVVPRNDPLLPAAELIIVLRSVLDGLVTALHIKLNQPSKHQLLLVMKKHFYALDLAKAVDKTCSSCHICASLQKFSDRLVTQSSEDLPETVGISFAQDVLKHNQKLILVLCGTVTFYTKPCFLESERRVTLSDNLLHLVVELYPLDRPCAVIRVDPAHSIMALREDNTLIGHNISLEIGRV